MTRRLASKHKVDRRLKVNLWGRPKSPFNSRNYPPGQHGDSRRQKLSNYGVQLREKQRIKYLYGVLEKQFRNYFKKASSKKGETGHKLLIMLESRLDNTVYRLGLAPTRRAARQLVSHKHFMVNNRIVNIPSFLLKPSDVINVRDKSRKMDLFQDSMRRIQGDNPMPWLTLDKAKLSGSYDAIPERDQINEPVNEQLVVELYSK